MRHHCFGLCLEAQILGATDLGYHWTCLGSGHFGTPEVGVVEAGAPQVSVLEVRVPECVRRTCIVGKAGDQ